MTSKQALDFIEKNKKQYGDKIRSFIKPSHLEELSQLLEVHIEAIEVRKDEFHEMDGGKAYMPRKETLDKFAAAAGVSYNQLAESTRKEPDGELVGRSQAMVMGPDGKNIYGDVCEYGFNPEDRVEELRLNGKADWDNKDQSGRPGKKEYTAIELEKERINFRKVGRQRANTGARNRATVSILGMPTGIKNLFEKREPPEATRVFLFSRIIVNAKNEMVMGRMLDGIAGNAAALFGSQAQIAAPAHAAAREPDPAEGARLVGPKYEAPAASEAPDFTDEPAVDPEIERTIGALVEWTHCGDNRIERRAQLILDKGITDLKVLRPVLSLLKYLGSGEKFGLGTAANALDMPVLDPIVLEDTLKKINAKAAAPAGAK